jgi:hypothetical protein
MTMKTDPEQARRTLIRNEQLRHDATLARNLSASFIVVGLVVPFYLHQQLGWASVGWLAACLAAGAVSFGVGYWLVGHMTFEDP